jgi:hypothetical protein
VPFPLLAVRFKDLGLRERERINNREMEYSNFVFIWRSHFPLLGEKRGVW